jgi:hypothetical protein
MVTCHGSPTVSSTAEFVLTSGSTAVMSRCANSKLLLKLLFLISYQANGNTQKNCLKCVNRNKSFEVPQFSVVPAPIRWGGSREAPRDVAQLKEIERLRSAFLSSAALLKHCLKKQTEKTVWLDLVFIYDIYFITRVSSRQLPNRQAEPQTKDRVYAFPRIHDMMRELVI